MPKCGFDPNFQHQLHRFVSDNALTVNGAATALGVDRTVFRRAYKFGTALESSKMKIRKALANRDKGAVSNDAVSAVGGGTQPRPTLQGVLADCELKQIRRVCEGVLTLLDHYESQTMGRKFKSKSPAETHR